MGRTVIKICKWMSNQFKRRNTSPLPFASNLLQVVDESVGVGASLCVAVQRYAIVSKQGNASLKLWKLLLFNWENSMNSNGFGQLIGNAHRAVASVV